MCSALACVKQICMGLLQACHRNKAHWYKQVQLLLLKYRVTEKILIIGNCSTDRTITAFWLAADIISIFDTPLQTSSGHDIWHPVLVPALMLQSHFGRAVCSMLLSAAAATAAH